MGRWGRKGRDGTSSGDLPEDSPDGEEHAEDTSIRNRATGEKPAEGNDQAGFDVTNHGTADRARARDDEELGEVDQRRQASALYKTGQNASPEHQGWSITYQEDHAPFVTGHVFKYREPVRPRNDVEQKDGSNRGLVVEQLKAIDFVFTLIRADPYRVHSRDEHAHHGQDDAQHADGSHIGGCRRRGLVV